jgi:hypothetical protein
VFLISGCIVLTAAALAESPGRPPLTEGGLLESLGESEFYMPAGDSCATIRYAGDPDWYYQMPRYWDYNDWPNVRFTTDHWVALKTVRLMFEQGPSTANAMLRVHIWDSDGTYPTDELGSTYYGIVSTWSPQWVTVDVSHLNIVVNGDFHVGFSIDNRVTDTLAIAADDGTNFQARSSMYFDYAEGFRLIWFAYESDRELLIDAEVCNVFDYTVSLPAELPFSHLNATTCGMDNDVDSTCVDLYDGGEDVIYVLNVTEMIEIDITIDPKLTFGTGMVLDDRFPIRAFDCLSGSSESDSSDHTLMDLELTEGTYYLLVDCETESECISEYDLIIRSTNVYEGPWHVAMTGNDSNEGSFEHPFRTIQQAIDAAAAGDSIYVRPGSYGPVQIDKSLNLYAIEGPTVTEISGDHSSRCVLLNAVSGTVSLEGFSLTEGLADGDGVMTGQGGGLLAIGSDVIISDCRIKGNQSNLAGGGLAFREESYFEIYDSYVCGNRSNTSGGGISTADASGGVIERTMIFGNEAMGSDGGGIYFYNPEIFPEGGFEIVNSIVADNNCIRFGSGVGVRSSSATITNTIIIGNASDSLPGAGVHAANSDVYLRYCDFFDNSPAHFASNGEGSLIDTIGIIFRNPLFLSGPSCDAIDLDACSPCVDAGDPLIPPDSNGGVRSDIGITDIEATCDLSVDSDSIDFGAFDTRRTFTVINEGEGILHWQATWNVPWLNLVPLQGTLLAGQQRIVEVRLSRTNLEPGFYTTTINLGSEAGSASVKVLMEVREGGPRLSVSPGTLDFGESDTQLQLDVVNDGDEQLDWSASWDSAWVGISVNAGSTPAEGTTSLIVGVTRGDLPIGTYQDTIRFASNGGSAKVVVIMEVPEPAPELSVSTSNLDFGHSETELLFTISNVGTAPLQWQITAGNDWLAASPISDTTAPGGSVEITVSADRSGLEIGEYAGTISITSDGGNAGISVSLDVMAPLLSISDDSLFFGESETEMVFLISNGGTESLQWSALSDSGWIGFDPSAGTVEVGASTEVTVTVDRTDLPAGNFYGTLHISSNGGDGEVVVAMEVAAQAELSVLPGSIDFGDADSTATLTVSNPGNTELHWGAHLASDDTWLTVTPDTGELAAGGSEIVTVEVDRPAMQPGIYSSVIDFTSNDGAVQVVVDIEVVGIAIIDQHPFSHQDMMIDDSVWFRFDVELDPASVHQGNFRVLENGRQLAGDYRLHESNHLAAFIPRGILPTLSRLTIELIGIRGINGEVLGTQAGTPFDAYTGTAVFPGDLNHDGGVDEQDIDRIALYWHSSGDAREDAADWRTWGMQSCSVWDNDTSATYADGNGDGIVDEADLFPIGRHWQLEHDFGVPGGAPAPALDPVEYQRRLQALYDAVKSNESPFMTRVKARLEELLDRETLPEQFSLYQNYPNPFNPSTSISFRLAESDKVTLVVVNAVGQQVRVLIDKVMPAGTHTITWDGRNSSGSAVASGVYFYELTSSTEQARRKMVLMK